MIRNLSISLALLTAAVAHPALAQKADYKPVEEKNLASGKQVIDKAKAYIFISAPFRTQGSFIKTPSAEELAEYEADWQKELAEAQRKYPGRLRRYESDLAIYQKTGSGKPPQKPEEPTAANFSIAPIETRMLVSFGPQFVYAKDTESDDKSFSYLVEVEPGTYTYYGTAVLLPGGQAFGECVCMGSVTFEAKAGEITSVGDFFSLRWASRAALEQTTVMRQFLRDTPPEPVDWSTPKSLTALPVVRADFRASGKMNNFFNLGFTRLPPIEGVLAYERDIPIDLKGLAEAKAAAEAQAKAEADARAAADAAATAAPAAGAAGEPSGE